MWKLLLNLPLCSKLSQVIQPTLNLRSISLNLFTMLNPPNLNKPVPIFHSE